MRRRSEPAIALLLALCLSLGGCFTFFEATKIKGGPVVYGGVRTWFLDRGNGWQGLLWFTVVCPLVDIPLCLVADTLLLPITLTKWATRKPEPPRPPRYHDRAPAPPRVARARYGNLPLRSWSSPRNGGLRLGLYRDIRIEPGDGSVTGAGVDRCVIDGDLVIVGSGIAVTGVRVLGKVKVLWGGDIDLRGCVIEGHVERLGRGAVLVPPGVEIKPWPERR